MNMLKTIFEFPFFKSFVLGQARNAAAIAGGYFVTHGLSAGYSQDQITGAIFCVAAVGFQALDTFVVDKKIKTASTTVKG